MVRLRFAPSPTGYLHVGNARIAVLNYLFAKKQGGKFLLRIDDTDTERSTKALEDAILEDMRWLGLGWDEFARQSERYDHYDQAIARLKEMGRLYPCFETPEELALKRKVQLGRGLPPVYDRGARALSQAEIDARLAAGETPHWRFLLQDKPISWHDGGRGETSFAPGHLSDPVLVREDGRVLYTLSSVVDDGLLQISHIVRGEDHVTNTAVQIDLFETLGFSLPEFIHLPLMLAGDGSKLSKRIGGLSLRELREAEVEPGALVAQLAQLGTSTAALGAETIDQLCADFAFANYGRAAPRFEEAQLTLLSQGAIHAFSFADVESRLAALMPHYFEKADIKAKLPSLWDAVKGNLTKLSEFADWVAICFEDGPKGEGWLPLAAEDKDYIATALAQLPSEAAWGDDVYDRWIDALKPASGRKGKALFMPLRLALTGRDKGPEMKVILPLMGHQLSQARLSAA